jgi:hypothetical protein
MTRQKPSVKQQLLPYPLEIAAASLRLQNSDARLQADVTVEGLQETA